MLLTYLDPGSGDKGLQLVTVVFLVVAVVVVVALLVLAFRFFIRDERRARRDRP